MKEDHMGNGQLKPAYNLQISTSDQYIVNYTLHQTPGDTTTLKQHLESYKKLYGKIPETLTADAGYGSEENYELLQSLAIKGYIKYNTFDKEQRTKNEALKSQTLFYNPDRDSFYCPMGQEMKKVSDSKRISANGFEQQVVRYQAQRCEGCPLRGSCHSAQGNRTIEVNHRLRKYKAQMSDRLKSDQGVAQRKNAALM